jgi:hypothetical protein
VVGASALAASSKAPVTNCAHPQMAAMQGGCVLDPVPSAPSTYSQALAKAAFAHDYAGIWSYLHPKLQSAVSEKSWENCQKRNPVASPGIKIKQVKIADSRRVPMTLPLLGKQKTRAVTVWVLFTAPGLDGQQIAIQYAYWVQDRGNWKAVWLPEVYSTYKSGKCDSGQQRALY